MGRWSGRVDSNHRPPGPEPGALARLSHAPTGVGTGPSVADWPALRRWRKLAMLVENHQSPACSPLNSMDLRLAWNMQCIED